MITVRIEARWDDERDDGSVENWESYELLDQATTKLEGRKVRVQWSHEVCRFAAHHRNLSTLISCKLQHGMYPEVLSGDIVAYFRPQWTPTTFRHLPTLQPLPRLFLH